MGNGWGRGRVQLEGVTAACWQYRSSSRMEQVEQMREGEEEVEENSNLLSVYELRGNGLHVSFHLLPADMSIC